VSEQPASNAEAPSSPQFEAVGESLRAAGHGVHDRNPIAAAVASASFPATKDAIVRACHDDGTLSDAQAEWLAAVLPDRRYESAEQAIAAYEELLGDPAQAEELGRRARERVLDEHTYAHRARQILEVVGVDVPVAARG
jgi:hypothetical protein